MPQSLVQIFVHLAFSTKGRAPFLKDRDFRLHAHAYLASICNQLESPAIKIDGVEDHVHIACRLSKQADLSSLVRDLKRDSSKWIKAERLRGYLPGRSYPRGSTRPVCGSFDG